MRWIVLFLPLLAACSDLAPSPPPPPNTTEAPAQEAGGSESVFIDPAVETDPQMFIDTDPTPLTREEIVGMWGLRESCGQPTVFTADGILTDYTGQSGRWSLNGDTLTIIRGDRTATSKVNQLNANAFTSGPPDTGDGRIRLFVIYQRC